MTNEHIAYLLLGSNQGDRKAYLEQALRLLGEQAGKVAATSHSYETEAWGNTEQDPFINLAAELHTELSPVELMDTILDIELQIGRERSKKWAPRIIDIDILFYEDLVLQTDHLTLPHPHLQERNFALIPLLELAPELKHPLLNKTVEELYWDSDDTLDVFRLDEKLI